MPSAPMTPTGPARPVLDRDALGSRVRDVLLVLALGFGSVGLFFRQQILNGFTVLSGDRFDGVIETTILEHWYNVWRGKAAFNVTNYFYPTPDTLGYNDGYFLYGSIYSFFRALGLNPFVASESVNIVMLTIGFLAFTWCAIAMLRLSVPVAAFGGALFALSGNLFIQLGHAQLLGVALAPLLAVLVYRCLVAAAENSRGRAFAYGLAAALLHAVWLMTTFYMAWYFLFAGLCFTLVAVVCSWRRLPVAWTVLRRNWFVALGVLAFYLLVNVPFVLTYLSKARETGQHGFDAVSIYIPSVLDVFNIGPDNLIFGQSYAILNQAIRPGFPDYGEKATGFPPLLLLLFALGFASALLRGRKAPSGPHRLAMMLALGTVLSWICILRVGDHTLWALLYSIIPGAKTVRVVARYQLFLSFPVTLLAVYYLQPRNRPPLPGGSAMPGRAPFTAALAVLLALLILEQVVAKPNVGLNVADEFTRLDAVPPAPKSCKSFYVSASREDSADPGALEGIYSHNVDAMMLAEYIGLPTLNGFSTFTPPDWYLTRPSESARYLADVNKYVGPYGLKNVCALNLHTLLWTENSLASP